MVEAVNDEHEGWQQGSVADLYRTAWERIRPLVGVSLPTGLGIAAGTLLLIVPGIVLAVRWSLAVPVLMLEKESPRAAMKSSRDLRFPAIAVLGPDHRTLATFIGPTFGGAISTPYLSHALCVVYYRLARPERPVIAEPGERWGTIWDEPEP